MILPNTSRGPRAPPPGKRCSSRETGGSPTVNYTRVRSVSPLSCWPKVSARGEATILLENSPEYVLCYFAVMKAGGVVVPLSDQTMARGSGRS